MKPLNYLDGFSGYGGFHKGLEQAGFEFDFVYYSEIDKHAIANYKYNYPQSLYAGSIDTICTGGFVKDIDLFTFGWPCQDNSIAGKRRGQRSGTRSGLLFESVKIINHFKPRAFIAENVTGLLSVNAGIDIIESLEILSYLNESCPQYDIEMQLLNTRWFLPQNRERLYFVGRLRGSGIGEVFPIGDGIGQVFQERNGKNSISGCLTQKSGSGQSQFDGSTTLIRVPSATISGFEEATTGDGINLEMPNSKTRRGRVGKGVAQTLTKSCNQGVIQINRSKESGGKQPYQQNRIYDINGICPALNSQISDQYKIQESRANRVYDINGDSVCLSSSTGGMGSPTGLYKTENRIRRLTPIECERLQGLPDAWTMTGNYDGELKLISDTQRYKLCGNGVSVPVVKLVGEKLLSVMP